MQRKHQPRRYIYSSHLSFLNQEGLSLADLQQIDPRRNLHWLQFNLKKNLQIKLRKLTATFECVGVA